MKIQILLELALFGALASGMAFDAPVVTAAAGMEIAVDLAPHPIQTMAPDIGRAELLKRDYQLTFLVGPDNTCGYFSGLSTSSYYCGGTGYTCDLVLSLYTSAGSPVGGIACCNTASCAARTTCIDSKAYAAGARCTSFCVACTDATRPYCGGVTISHLNVRDLFCDTTTTNGFQPIDTTYPNQLSNRVFQTSSVLITSSSSGGASSSLPVPTSAQTTPATGPASSPTTAISQSGGSGSSTSASSSSGGSSTTTTPAQQDNSGPPIGAIVGGVIGGVAVLVLIGVIIFFVMRKKRRAAQNAQQPQQPFNPQQNQAPPPMGQYYEQPGGPGPAMGGAAAGAAWGYGQNMNQPVINEAPGSFPQHAEKPYYHQPPLNEAPGSTMPTSYYQAPLSEAPGSTYPPSSASPPPGHPGGYGSPQSGHVSTYNPNSASPHGPGSPEPYPPRAQLSGNNAYPHHNTIYEVGG